MVKKTFTSTLRFEDFQRDGDGQLESDISLVEWNRKWDHNMPIFSMIWPFHISGL